MAGGSEKVDSRGCSKCGEKRRWTGSRWRCGPCFNAWQAQRRSNLTAAQKAADNVTRTRSRQAWSPERRAAANERVAVWREANRERHRKASRTWYWANPEARRTAKIAEYRANPVAFHARNQVRKARVRDAVCEHGSGCVSGEFLKVVYADTCLYCGAPAEHADHFIPLAGGGAHCRDNIVPACAPCNESKKASDPWLWLEGRTG